MTYKNITNLGINRLLTFLTRKFDGKETVVVCQNDMVLDHASTPDIRIDSLMVKGPLADTYTIYLRKNGREAEKIICHEFVHLMQMLRGDLIVDEKTPRFIWKGNPYDPSYPYRWRPWEKEAFNRQSYLYREYKATI